jgi:uncharacterized protein (DUF779 family)
MCVKLAVITVLLTTVGLMEKAQTGGVGSRDQPPDAARVGTQPAATGTGTITGVVLIAGTGQPARQARVTLSGAELRSGQSTITDDQGRFSFSALPAGRYAMNATKLGYLSVSFGQRWPGTLGTAIQLTDGQKFQATLQIPRGSVVTGTILDVNDETVSGVSVHAIRVVNDRRIVEGGTTDDRGIYRIYGLHPGEYTVCASPRDTNAGDLARLELELEAMSRQLAEIGRTGVGDPQVVQERIAALRVLRSSSEQAATGYAPVCYPGTTTISDASPVRLGVGEERPGIDFQLRLVPLARIEGNVINSTGAQLQGLEVTLQDAASGSISLGTLNNRPDADGRFTIPGVAPGHYKLTAHARIAESQRGAPPLAVQTNAGAGASPQPVSRPEVITVWASTDLIVDGRNVTNVMLSLQNGTTVSGQIRLEGSIPPPADLTRMRVRLMATESNLSGLSNGGRVDANGRFTILSVPPGRYRISAGGARDWFIQSAVTHGVDVLDFSFELKPNQNVSDVVITLTDRQTELTGVVIDSRNQPAFDYTLLIFPADQKYWASSRRMQMIRPATDGRYMVRNLPSGDYKIATVLDVEPGALQDPAFLRQIDAATLAISLAAGEKKSQDIRVSAR